jgi:hypothetical protein
MSDDECRGLEMLRVFLTERLNAQDANIARLEAMMKETNSRVGAFDRRLTALEGKALAWAVITGAVGAVLLRLIF